MQSVSYKHENNLSLKLFIMKYLFSFLIVMFAMFSCTDVSVPDEKNKNVELRGLQNTFENLAIIGSFVEEDDNQTYRRGHLVVFSGSNQVKTFSYENNFFVDTGEHGDLVKGDGAFVSVETYKNDKFDFSVRDRIYLSLDVHVSDDFKVDKDIEEMILEG